MKHWIIFFFMARRDWVKQRSAGLLQMNLEVNIKETSGPVIEKPGDLAGFLTNLEPNDVLFIDEIHRLSNVVEEYLYAAMEDYRIDIMIDTGPNARSVQINLNPFTLIGATTRSGLINGATSFKVWYKIKAGILQCRNFAKNNFAFMLQYSIQK